MSSTPSLNSTMTFDDDDDDDDDDGDKDDDGDDVDRSIHLAIVLRISAVPPQASQVSLELASSFWSCFKDILLSTLNPLNDFPKNYFALSD